MYSSRIFWDICRLTCTSAADLGGTARDRGAYDHSRNGPVRADSNWSMTREASFTFGIKPNHMYSVWKG